MTVAFLGGDRVTAPRSLAHGGSRAHSWASRTQWSPCARRARKLSPHTHRIGRQTGPTDATPQARVTGTTARARASGQRRAGRGTRARLSRNSRASRQKLKTASRALAGALFQALWEKRGQLPRSTPRGSERGDPSRRGGTSGPSAVGLGVGDGRRQSPPPGAACSARVGLAVPGGMWPASRTGRRAADGAESPETAAPAETGAGRAATTCSVPGPLQPSPATQRLCRLRSGCPSPLRA